MPAAPRSLTPDDARARLAIGAAVGGFAGFLARDLRLSSLVSYWGDQVPLLAASLFLGAVLWLTPLRRVLVWGVALLLATWLVVVTTPLVGWLGTDLVRDDPLPDDAEAIFVLASRMQDDGDPTFVSMSRLLHGLELVAEGRAPRLVVSELPPPYQPYAPWARALMQRFDVEAELLSVGPVQRTRDEALAVAALFRERGWRRAILVTSPVHTRRAAASFEREGLEVFASPAYETAYDWPGLDRPDDRLSAFGAIMHEWLGLAYYAWRGWIPAAADD